VVAMVHCPDSHRADRWLRSGGKPGTFLLRPSSSGKEGQLALFYLKSSLTMAQERVTVSISDGTCTMLAQTFPSLLALLEHFEHQQLPGGVVLSDAETYSDRYVQQAVNGLAGSAMTLDDVLQAAAVVKGESESQHGCKTANGRVDVQQLLQWFAPVG